MTPAIERTETIIDENIQDWISDIRIEKENIRIFLMRKAFETEQEATLELLVHQYQATITRLSDSVFDFVRLHKVAAPQILYDELLNCFEDLLKHLEQRYGKYFNRDEKVTDLHLHRSLKKISVKVKSLKNGLGSHAIDEELTGVIISGIQEFIKGKGVVSYNGLEYTKELISELENIPDKNNLSSRDVMRVLVSLNFNSAAFISYLTNGIISAINTHNEQHEKIGRLHKYFKDISQVRIKPGARFNIHNECVKQQVAGWINEEVYFLEQKQQMVATMPVMKEEGPIPEEHKLHLSTSVEVLTLLARAGKDSKLILNKQMTGMFRSIARFCRTRNAESPAANSMLKKSYVADHVNKQKAIDILHEMIKCIHRYCIIPAFIYFHFLDEIIGVFMEI